MNEALEMQISAYVDGELAVEEAELLTRRLCQDAALRAQVSRYLAIGRLLRGEAPAAAAVGGLRERIAAALDGETTLPADPVESVAPKRWLRPVAGMAVAASVALVALVGLRHSTMTEAGVADVPPAAVAVTDELRSTYTEPAASQVVSDRPSDRLMQYYLSHGATSGDLGANGILTRLVTLEMRGDELVEVPPAERRLAPNREPADNPAEPDDTAPPTDTAGKDAGNDASNHE